MKSKLLLAASIVSLGLVSCGGGGSSSAAPTTVATIPPAPTPPPPPPPSSNVTPIAVASSAISQVSLGGAFVVTASGSSDADGDTLNFSWVQTAGPSVLQAAPIQEASLSLNAPIVTQDTDLTFEVTVSDGTDSTTDTVTITAQPLAPPVAVRPVGPINTTVAALNGITDEGGGQYRIYWTDGFTSEGNNVIASQIFSDNDTPVGNQLNGSFELPQAGGTSSTQINGLVPLSVIENGGTTYAPLIYIFENAVPAFGNLVGPLVGNLSPVRDPEITFDPGTQFDQTPIGQNNVVTVNNANFAGFASIMVNILSPDGNFEAVPAAIEEQDPQGSSENVREFTDPAVSAIGPAGYIVAWRSEDANVSPRARTIEAQIYTSANAQSGSTLTLDASTGPSSDLTSQLDAATFGNGSSLITWVESQAFADNGDFIDFVVRARVVSPDGSFIGDEFTISESPESQFFTSSLSLSNGDVLVVWGEGDGAIKARILSSDGSSNSLGAEFELSQNDPSTGFALANAFETTQTETGRVIIGYNLTAGNTAITSDVISFCPVGCE